jgi:hypothetical protein
LVLGSVGWAVWKFFLVKKWVEAGESEGNVDADEALENLEGTEGDEDGEKKEDEKEKGKGKGGKGKKK